MENTDLIKKHEYKVSTTQGQVTFQDYDNILDEAQNLANHVKQLNVDEENIKESKRLVAAMNNRIKDINETRKEVKKTMLQPYNEFETQVKTIEGVINDAVNHVRVQERELTERERDEKRKEIAELFDKRIQHYDFESIMGFADFLDNSYLTKSYSMPKVEEKLVQWLEMVRQDMTMIDRHIKKHPEDRDELIVEYQNTQNISQTFDNFERRQEKKRQAAEQARKRELQAKRDTRKQEEKKQQDGQYCITVSEKDIFLIKEFLKRNEIDFESKKIK
ncbi:DUF1351 domain-containing protein [Staphylococcus pseudoxylosus]|uniref:DUF1351 domain-containing protein n=1 Tax=Staphylococcus pseudoxylosus TaxID=2282419 RepID=UPI002DBCE4C6|nr:DUF1351 domain-containing protein [Staphylococcus pseudoxylosus]MEB8088222.1 DUF1351 domain-containing protein [Staphylococcus pseudoxylosus]